MDPKYYTNNGASGSGGGYNQSYGDQNAYSTTQQGGTAHLKSLIQRDKDNLTELGLALVYQMSNKAKAKDFKPVAEQLQKELGINFSAGDLEARAKVVGGWIKPNKKTGEINSSRGKDINNHIPMAIDILNKGGGKLTRHGITLATAGRSMPKELARSEEETVKAREQKKVKQNDRRPDKRTAKLLTQGESKLLWRPEWDFQMLMLLNDDWGRVSQERAKTVGITTTDSVLSIARSDILDLTDLTGANYTEEDFKAAAGRYRARHHLSSRENPQVAIQAVQGRYAALSGVPGAADVMAAIKASRANTSYAHGGTRDREDWIVPTARGQAELAKRKETHDPSSPSSAGSGRHWSHRNKKHWAGD